MVSETSGVFGSFDRIEMCFSRVAREKPRFKVKESSPLAPGASVSGFNAATVQPQDGLGGCSLRMPSPVFLNWKTPETVVTCEVLPKS